MPTDSLEIDLWILIGSLAAGCLGGLVGRGGGIALVPMLVLLFGVEAKIAMGASLVAVIGTSTGAAIRRGRSRLSNHRVAIVLELAATFGAIAGAATMTLAHPALLLVLAALVTALELGTQLACPERSALSPSRSCWRRCRCL